MKVSPRKKAAATVAAKMSPQKKKTTAAAAANESVEDVIEVVPEEEEAEAVDVEPETEPVEQIPDDENADYEEDVEDENIDDEEYVEDEAEAEGDDQDEEEMVDQEGDVEENDDDVEEEDTKEEEPDEEADEIDEDAANENDETKEDTEEQDEVEIAKIEGESNIKPTKSIGKFDTIEDSEIRKILKTSTIKLFDGSRGLLFSRGPKYSDEKWPINCHICYESGIMNVQQLKEHLKSIRHVRMMQWRPTDPKYKHSKVFKQPFEDDDPNLTPIFIYPGEVITEITPDLIDRIICRSDLPEKEYRKAMGLSYAFKMKRTGRGDNYECVLCNKSPVALDLSHFRGQKHIDKYTDAHFPKTYKRLRKIQDELDPSTLFTAPSSAIIRHAIRLIYRKIETDLGIRIPKTVTFRDYKINRTTYLKQIETKKHYGDRTMEITDEFLKEIFKQACEQHAPKPDGAPPLRRDRRMRDSTKKLYNRTGSVERKTGATPGARATSSDKKAQQWDRYRRMIGAILDDLDETYERYKKDPESHPRYKSEWKKFWHNRADELEKKGIDPHKFDFNAEWIPYWENLLREFQAKTIVKQKYETKRKLSLRTKDPSPSPIRRPKRTARKRLPSPRSRRRSGSRSRDIKRARRNEPVSIVAVMRLVAALEENLGSLGPQAVQLLGRAVLTEKSNPNAGSLLMENDFYIFFMTAKEKLKGQLQADIVERRKIDAVNRTIDQISIIIKKFEDFRARNGGGSIGGIGGGGGGGGRQHYQKNQNRSQNIGNDNDSGTRGGGGGGGGEPELIRYPNQYSGGSRGGVWHSGNYRMESGNTGGGGGNMPSNYRDNGGNNNSMNFRQQSATGQEYGGDDIGNDGGFGTPQGGDNRHGYSGRGNQMSSSRPQNNNRGGRTGTDFGRSDFHDDESAPPSIFDIGRNNNAGGGNFGTNYGSSNTDDVEMGYNNRSGTGPGNRYSDNFNAPPYRSNDGQREHSGNIRNVGVGGNQSVYNAGSNRGGRYSDGSNKSEPPSNMGHNRNSMPSNRGSGGGGGGNQMSLNRNTNRTDTDGMPFPPKPPQWPTTGYQSSSNYQSGNVTGQQYSGGGGRGGNQSGMDSMKGSFQSGSNTTRNIGGGGGLDMGAGSRGGYNSGGGGGIPMGWNRSSNQMNFNRGGGSGMPGGGGRY